MADEQGGAAGELGEKAAEKAGGVAGRVAGGAVGSALPGVGTVAGQAAGKVIGEQAVKQRGKALPLLIGCALLLLVLPVLFISLFTAIGPFFGPGSPGGQQVAVGPSGSVIGGPGAAASGVGFANVPYFSQGDPRWRNNPYGSPPCQPREKSTMKTSACGPTSLAMILKYYGKDVDPPKIASLFERQGCRQCGQGSTWGCMTEIPIEVFGLRGSRSLANSRSQVLNSLRNGQPVIGVFGRGYFTQRGHYVVLTGINAQGNIHFNDPARRGVGKTTQANVFGSSKNFFLIAP